MSVILLLIFSYRSFVVSGFIFRPFIHFELIFMSGVKQRFNFIVLHVDIVFPASFIEKITHSPLSILGSLSKYQLTIYLQVSFWALYSVPLVYVSGFMPVPRCSDYYNCVIWFGIRKCGASSFVFLFSGMCWLFRVFCGTYKF